MGVNSRKKGDNGEKLVAKLMEEWTKRKFTRAPTNNFIHKRTASNSKGDIICNTEGHFFPFCVEVKTYKEINFEHLLYLPTAKILDFWKQVTTDGELSSKCPVLFMRYNGLPKNFYFVAIQTKIYDQFFQNHIKLPLTLRCEHHGFILLTSKDFFQAPYKEIRKPIKKYLKTLKPKK